MEKPNLQESKDGETRDNGFATRVVLSGLGGGALAVVIKTEYLNDPEEQVGMTSEASQPHEYNQVIEDVGVGAVAAFAVSLAVIGASAGKRLMNSWRAKRADKKREAIKEEFVAIMKKNGFKPNSRR